MKLRYKYWILVKTAPSSLAERGGGERLNGREFLKGLVGRYQEKFGRRLDGRAKLQKLTFLVEHWDPETERIVRSKGLTGYRFIVWLYGPYSEPLTDDIDFLVNRGVLDEEEIWFEREPSYNGIYLGTYVDDGEPRRIYLYGLKRCKPKLNPKLVSLLDEVLEKFGDFNPVKLEEHVNSLLSLTPLKKREYWGRLVDEYLEHEGLL